MPAGTWRCCLPTTRRSGWPRNTTLLVKQVGAAEDTLLGLEAGAIWARAERGGEGLTIETPAAAAAIRGTDWSMTVDGAARPR